MGQARHRGACNRTLRWDLKKGFLELSGNEGNKDKSHECQAGCKRQLVEDRPAELPPKKKNIKYRFKKLIRIARPFRQRSVKEPSPSKCDTGQIVCGAKGQQTGHQRLRSSGYELLCPTAQSSFSQDFVDESCLLRILACYLSLLSKVSEDSMPKLYSTSRHNLIVAAFLNVAIGLDGYGETDEFEQKCRQHLKVNLENKEQRSQFAVLKAFLANAAWGDWNFM